MKETRFCSRKCKDRFARKVPEEVILQAIEMREQGQTWIGISRVLGASYHNLQRGIWRLLDERGLLTVRTAAQLWKPSSSLFRASYSWQAVAKETGIMPMDG